MSVHKLEEAGKDNGFSRGLFSVTFPQHQQDNVPQDEEYCIVHVDGGERKIRFHDYDQIYNIPGLYEHIFYEKLECQSPAMMGQLLLHETARQGLDVKKLNVLDVGAGNGIMGEVLTDAGVENLVGVDILTEAAQAATRDRPGIYDAYYTVDLLDPPEQVETDLADRDFNCLTMIAALGFGDIPPEVFATSFNYIEKGGYVAFNLKEDFMEQDDSTGFGGLIREMIRSGCLEECLSVHYVHRLSMTGDPLFYNGMIARKRAHLPPPALRS